MGVIITAIIGGFNALFLSLSHSLNDGVCGISSCYEVLASPFSKLLGVPLAFFGLVYFMLVLFSIAKKDSSWALPSSLLAKLTVFSAFYALWLTVYQLFFIQGFCIYCALNFLCILIILILTKAYKHCTEFNHTWDILKKPVFLILIAFSLPFILVYGVPKLKNSYNKSFPRPAAMINNKAISLTEIDTAISMKKAELSRYLYETRKRELDRRVLLYAAKDEGLPLRAYMSRQLSREIRVTTADINAYAKENKIVKPKSMSEELFHGKIKQGLTRLKQEERINDLIESVYKKYTVKLMIPLPEKILVSDNPLKSPGIGNPKARIVIQEFSDFECPYCARAATKMKDLLKKYPDDIYLVFRHNPLAMHKQAKSAAIAAQCADRQGQFWAYSDRLFENQNALSTEDLLRYAQELQLDMTTFKPCLGKKETKPQVMNDIKEANRLGVRSTPSFIINGTLIKGIPTEKTIQEFLKKDAKKN